MLELVARVERRRAVEDDWIELKAQWPTDHYRAARQIAGLANASRASSVLWIVGLDEQSGVVESLESVEVSEWWAQVARHFDEEEPRLQCLTVPTSGEKCVVALLFETVTPVPRQRSKWGPIKHEAPWERGQFHTHRAQARTAPRGDSTSESPRA